MIEQLDEDLVQRYPREDIHGLDFSDPKVAQVTFAVAYANGAPVGCGGIRPIDAESTELKRFFVQQALRGTGTAARLLAFLEEEAKKQGFAGIKLETGNRQPEAIRFYEKNGYALIEPYGEYVGGEYSVCFEKRFD
ncbi:GNAT family N-acetyltransferase [Cohnella sp. AR92]|uniref:GNAT family N-acetyltransferase n=1 Tax=Cohnella sp. AR92 TaxID=648716 RepID=UPI000F8CC215|nr:GNAT family N-acetyltransferase [Cohnella sp. AR92]RUS46496.1 N-acetyltransferase [Cohnella sp. AR92]